MVFVLVSRSRRVVPDELVSLTSWDARDFLCKLDYWGGNGWNQCGVACFIMPTSSTSLRFLGRKWLESMWGRGSMLHYTYFPNQL